MLIDSLDQVIQEQEPKTTEQLFEETQEGELFKRLTESLRGVMPQIKEELEANLIALLPAYIQQATSQIQVKDGRPGRDGKDGRDGTDGKDGKDATIDKEALIKEVMDKIPPLVLSRRGGGGGGGGTTVVTDDLSSQPDGSTRTFTTTKKIGSAILVASTQFPTILRPIIDYTASGTTLTLNSSLDPIASGQTLICIYAEG